MLKFGSVQSNKSQSSTSGLPTNGGLVLKYFLSETIHNGSRGGHFAKFLISNFLKGLTYSIYITILILTMNTINIFFASFFILRTRKSTMIFPSDSLSLQRCLVDCPSIWRTTLSYKPHSTTSQNTKLKRPNTFHVSSKILHGSWLSLQQKEF